ncbi:hypothetical protein ASD24_25330 [Paenibacillus sp. Root52]|uniref:hypothetical protein n=1 Tax=Paenibacillus sp. Root52 TaxID=1736552 RepID=UPI0006FCEA1B|nr:hypothetical protein [Paenibacillus sp. Root52]KQY90222.1 hypothetical protein ASD24_25330 [Paenibacillus sp. Root52]
MTDGPDNSNHERDDHNELGEHSTRPIHLTQGEINALEKAIMYLKFECNETDSLLYAGSPLLNSVLEKARDASRFGEFAKDFHSRPNEYAETFMRDKLERSYAEELAPRERSTVQKDEILRTCMFPYPVK